MIRQTLVGRYYSDYTKLLDCLQKVFPGQADFRLRLTNNTWSFMVPREVTEAELRDARD